jgi:hypothetical protein
MSQQTSLYPVGGPTYLHGDQREEELPHLQVAERSNKQETMMLS